jgi:hypothetical protein
LGLSNQTKNLSGLKKRKNSLAAFLVSAPDSQQRIYKIAGFW